MLMISPCFPPTFHIPSYPDIYYLYQLYNPAIFIPMNAKSIPAPTRQPPQISILISQYIISATTGLDIP